MSFLNTQLDRFHRDQKGAVALLALAALLILLMLALVVLDTGEAARDKLTVQSAADAAAWSEAAVEARAMNMIAFANVAKRVTVGMTAFYDALWLAYGELALLTGIAIAAACIAAFFSAGAAATLCEKTIEFGAELVKIIGGELKDGNSYYTSLRPGYFKDDIIALDNYQSYMAELAPWWAYAEGIQRGIRNGAAITASFPVPESTFPSLNIPFDLGNMDLSDTGIDDELPIQRASADEGPSLMCDRVGSTMDYLVHGLDYAVKNFSAATDNWKAALIYGITDAMALLQLKGACREQMGHFGKESQPWRLKKFESPAEWLTHSSNLTFSYLPNKDRMNQARERLDIVDAEFGYQWPLGEPIHTSGGYWAMARSEISYQNGTPDLWHPSWSARMRPVAFPGEWTTNGITLGRALNDVLPAMAFGAGIGELLDGDLDLAGEGKDLLRVLTATQAYNSSGDSPRIEGLAK